VAWYLVKPRGKFILLKIYCANRCRLPVLVRVSAVESLGLEINFELGRIERCWVNLIFIARPEREAERLLVPW